MNTIPVAITRPKAGELRAQSPIGLALDLADANGTVPQGPATLGIRPEHFKIAADGQGNFSADVVIVERLGVETYMTVGSPEQPIVVRAEGDVAVRPGDRVSLNADAAACHLFDSAGRVIRQAQAS
jgi:multiple sugar transport system ATP-binding protein